MPKSTYFDYMGRQSEKDLIMELAQEVISINGMNVKWLSNTHVNIDELFKEDRLPIFEKAKDLVVLVSNPGEGIVGDAIFSKFGFQNNQQITIQISVKEWREIFKTHRPNEGDIFFLPKMDEYGLTDFFKVTFVDKEEAIGWYSFGKHSVFQVTAEKWAYSSENFGNSGVQEIDEELPNWTNDVEINPNLDGDPWKANDAVEKISDDFVVWDKKNPFGS